MTENIENFDKKKNQWVFPDDGVVITKAEVEEVYSYLSFSDKQALENSPLKEEVEPEILSQLHRLKKKILDEEQERRKAEALRTRREEEERQRWEEARKAAVRQQYLIPPISSAIRQYKKARNMR